MLAIFVVAWLYLCHWIFLFPTQAGTGIIWMAQIQHWNDLNSTNSVLLWLSVQVLPAGAWAQGGLCPLHVLHRTHPSCVSCSLRLRHSKELVFVKSEDGFLLKWYEMTRWNVFVREKITWECWTSSCSCIFMKLLN